MRYSEAIQLANHLVDYMRPGCERIEIAGSLRRECDEVKDLELVVIPKTELRPVEFSLLGDMAQANLLYEMVRRSEFIQWIKPGTSVLEPWPIKPDGKYWRGMIQRGRFDAPANIKLDLFLVRPENWGVIFAIRTGSADFSRALVTHAKNRTEFRVDGGHLTHHGENIECREELHLFEALGVELIEPRLRNGDSDLRRLRGFKH